MKTAHEIQRIIEQESNRHRWEQIYHSYYLLKFYMEYCIIPFERSIQKLIEEEAMAVAKGKKKEFRLRVKTEPFPKGIFASPEEAEQMFHHLLSSGILEIDYESFSYEYDGAYGVRRIERTNYADHLLFRPIFNYLTVNGFHCADFKPKTKFNQKLNETIHDFQMEYLVKLS